MAATSVEKVARSGRTRPLERRGRRLGSRVLPALLAAISTVGACGDGGASSEIIEFCIPVEAKAEQPPVLSVVPGRNPDRPEPPGVQHFLLGTEYPITTLDASAYARIFGQLPETDPDLEAMDVVVVDAMSIEPGEYVSGRAVFHNFDVLVTSLPPIGPTATARHYDGIFAGDLLRRYAVRLAYVRDPSCQFPWTQEQFPTVTFLEELPDRDEELGGDGFAVFPFTLAGGGTFLLDGQSHDFGATRIGVTVCLEPDTFDVGAISPDDVSTPDDLETLIPATGVDAFFLLATGTSGILVSRQLFDRLQALSPVKHPTTRETYELPTGRVDVLHTSLVRLAVVSNTSDGLPPCQELARRRRIAWIRSYHTPDEWKEGPWHITSAGPAVAEFDGARSRDATHPIASLDTYVIEDRELLLQGLRFEMAEDLPQVDGLLGHDFLRRFEIFLDYPNTRIAFRCGQYLPPPEGESCDLDQVNETGHPCCDSQSRCLCPATNPCCQLPATRLP